MVQVAAPFLTLTSTCTVKFGPGSPTPKVRVAPPLPLVYPESIEVVVGYFLVIFTGASGKFDETMTVSCAVPAGLLFDIDALQKYPAAPTVVVVVRGDVVEDDLVEADVVELTALELGAVCCEVRGTVVDC